MKDKKIILLIVVVVIIVVAIVYTKSGQEKPVSWTPTFYNTDTNPYGTYINYDLLKDIFPDAKIRSTRLPVYNNLKEDMETYFQYNTTTNDNSYDNSYYDDDEYEEDIYEDDSEAATLNQNIDELYLETSISDTTAYIFVNSSFEIDKVDLEYLLDFAGLGNNVFIVAENFYKPLLDTLGIEEKKMFYGKDTIYTLVDYPKQEYAFPFLYSETYFDLEKCKVPARVLGRKKNNDAVFIQLKYGHGNIYLHSVPMAFTNLYMLDTDKYDYAFRSLSYIPATNNIIWDEYQKQGTIGKYSIFRVIYNSKALTLALIITLIGFLLFMIFRAKRTQRIIPIIKPPVNSSIEFLETISNLYYRKKDFKTIIAKRQAYLLDFIRKNYYLPTEHIDSSFIKNLSLKSNVDETTLNELFATYKDLSALHNISNEQFLKYNSLLETFYKSVKNN